MKYNRLLKTIGGSLIVATAMMTCFATGGHAAMTLNLPDYRKPVLDPSSQASAAWTNVIPNALADYFTYVPYRTADAVKLGFPTSCGRLPDDKWSTEDCYTITVKKFQQGLSLPAVWGFGGPGLLDPAGTPFGATTWVQGYGSGGKNWTPPGAPAGVKVTGNAPALFAAPNPALGIPGNGIWHFPAPSVKGTKGRPIRIQWLNELPNEKQTGFDPTICDNMPKDCFPYNRIATHVHGAHVGPDSDGFANAWFTPGFAEKGDAWVSTTKYGPEGTYRYPMDQEAGTIWYHDHAMGLTHDNTNMGMAGFFPITDDNEKYLRGLPPGNAATKILPTGAYELGFALQDRVFYSDGQVAAPDAPIIDIRDINCTFTYQADGTITPNDLTQCTNTPLFMQDLTDGLADHHLIPYQAAAAGVQAQPLLATSTSLEFFGNIAVVNGVVNGTNKIEPRVYRMRFIGGTDSRTWIMQLKNGNAIIPFWQIGTEQGFLDKPVALDSIVLMPGERMDVLVDFKGIAPGTRVMMKNLGPDVPYNTMDQLIDPSQAPSIDIPDIMAFDIVDFAKDPKTNLPYPDVPTPNANQVLNNIRLIDPAQPGVTIRKVSLWEITDQYGRIMPTIDGRGFGGEVTEILPLNSTEQWDIINTTVDAHPMHLHQVAFQLINREDINVLGFTAAGEPILDVTNAGVLPGPLTPPDYVVTQPPGSTLVTPLAHEGGWKDTITCPPGKVTRVIAKFDIPGVYVWHCHILSHEEHDMMRPLVVTTPAAYVKLTASDDSRISGAPVTMVHLNASTKTSIHDYPDGSGFEYQFSVTPPQGVAVTQPMPHMTMLSGSTPGYSLSHGAMWTPPTVPGKYVVTVKTKALGPVSAANPVKSDSLSFIVTGPAIAGATSTTPSGIFKAGSAVNVTVTFNQPVSSTGLSITLNDGAILKTGALANATSFSGIYTVAAGQNIAALNVTSITGTITDAANNKIVNPAVPAGYNISNSVKLVIDTIVPTLTVQAPLLTHTPTITVSGKTSDTNGIKSLTVNGKSVAIGYGGTFSTQVTMSSVFNKVTTIATDKAGNVTTEVRNVIFK